MKHQEKILVVKRQDVIPALISTDMGVQYGSSSDLTPIDYQWVIRADAEVDPSVKQIIPYVVVTKLIDDKINFLTYVRSKGSGEPRLLGERSIGFGGHIDQDLTPHLDESHKNIQDHVFSTANRELHEEIGLSPGTVRELLLHGFINNDTDDVGSVHLGVYMSINVSSSWEPTQRESGVSDLKWLTIDDIMEDNGSYEVWSQILIENLVNPNSGVLSTTTDMEMHSAEFAAISQPVGMSAEESIAFYARVSNPNNQMNHESAPKLIKYLVVNSHWSPFDMVQLTLKVRTTRSVMAQILRHWSFRFQEFSQRYSEVSSFDFSKVEARVKADGGNRQGSADVCDEATAALQELCHERAQDYLYLVDDNIMERPPIAPECARDILPMATPTTGYMTGSVRSWMTYFWQRLCPHAQQEHREAAWSMFEIFEQKFPMIAELVLTHKPKVIECDWVSERPIKCNNNVPCGTSVEGGSHHG